MIGVTVTHGAKAENIVPFVTRKHTPYVLTKPLHPLQKLIDDNEYGITVLLEVQHNFELEKEINALDLYNTSITGKGIVSLGRNMLKTDFAR